MASTSQLRASYPEFIVNPSVPRCNFTAAVPVVFPASGSSYPSGRVTLKVHPKTRQLYRALAAVMLAFGYVFVETAGGTLACRKITGGTGTTLHAHGIAGDWNPSRNRYRVTTGGGLIQFGRQTDMPAAMVRAIEAIEMTNGRHPWEWGGRWLNVKDPMHYEVDVLSSQLAPVNLATLPAGAWARYLAFETNQPDQEEEPMLPITPTSTTEDKRRLQVRLVRTYGETLTLDGDYGPKTAAAVKTRLLGFTGADEDPNASPEMKAGYYVNALMWEGMADDRIRQLIASLAGPGGGDHPDTDHQGLATTAQLAAFGDAFNTHGHGRPT
jgi:hypothetical protein